MMRRLFKGLMVLLVLIVVAPPVEAAIYQCRDAAGRLTAQDHPCGPGMVTLKTQSTQQHGHMMMWQVSGPRGKAYLVGSIHFGTPDMYPLPVEMTRAFAASKALVVETNLTAIDPNEMARIVASKAMYRDGTTLSSVLTPKTWQELTRVLKEFGVPANLVERQKPWMVSMTLTGLALRRFGFDENLGIDNHFMKLAAKSKPILQMETFEQQLNFLDGFSLADQEQMLKETFDDIDKGRDFLADTLKAWRNGDAQKIDTLMNVEMRQGGAADERMYQVLVAQRNRTMTNKIDELLHQDGTYFVVLGSAHFVGADGIVAKLKRKGYSVHQF